MGGGLVAAKAIVHVVLASDGLLVSGRESKRASEGKKWHDRHDR